MSISPTATTAIATLRSAILGLAADLNHTIRDSERGATPVETRDRLQLIANQAGQRLNGAWNQTYLALLAQAELITRHEHTEAEQAHTIHAQQQTIAQQQQRLADYAERDARNRDCAANSGICPLDPVCPADLPCYVTLAADDRAVADLQAALILDEHPAA